MTRAFTILILSILFVHCTSYKTFYKETYTTSDDLVKNDVYRLEIIGKKQLEHIPIAYLDKLAYLKLSAVSVKDMDLFFAQLQYPEKLHVLILDSLDLNILPFTITRFKNLNQLSINNNPRLDLNATFKTLQELPIHFLNLQYNKLVGLPESITQLVTLRDLNLSNNTIRDKALFESLAKLPELSSLWLTNNNLENLPKAIGQLSQLKSLYLEHNRLVEIPLEVSGLKKLSTLHIGYNNFKKLPVALTDIPSLILLHINNCSIKSIPYDYASKKYSIKGIILDHNQLPDTDKQFWKKELRDFFLLSME